MNKHVCIGCGVEVAILDFICQRGPYCQRCQTIIPPRSEFWYPTAYSCWRREEHDAIDRVIRSGRFTMGAEVAAFEREFADWHGKTHGIMVNSGSSANLVAIASLFHVKPDGARKPLKLGDVALVPALAWSTTYAPLVQHGLELILVDCDGTWNADFYSLEVDIEKARLVVGCSILGNPAELQVPQSVAGVLGAWFFEDNCESLGAYPRSEVLPGAVEYRHCGAFGDLSTFSFFWSHQLSAIEGGMILTDDDELAMLCRMLRAHGWTRDVSPLLGWSHAAPAFNQEYDFRLFGYNVRPLEMHAAVAREQLRRLVEFQRTRNKNADLFREMTQGIAIVHPESGGVQNPFGLAFEVVGGPEARNRLVLALRAAGIDCRLPTGGSFRLHAYGEPWRSQETPNADRIHHCGLFLGNGPLDLTDRIERAVATMKETL